MCNECRMTAAFEGQGDFGFGVWTYATCDPLEEVLKEGYFARGFQFLRPGDLIFVGSRPPRYPSPWSKRVPETRRALLMVGPVERGKPISARLVVDFGRPEDPGPSSAPPRRPAEPKGGS